MVSHGLVDHGFRLQIPDISPASVAPTSSTSEEQLKQLPLKMPATDADEMPGLTTLEDTIYIYEHSSRDSFLNTALIWLVSWYVLCANKSQ